MSRRRVYDRVRNGDVVPVDTFMHANKHIDHVPSGVRQRALEDLERALWRKARFNGELD